MNHQGPLKHRLTSTRLQVATFQNTVFFNQIRFLFLALKLLNFLKYFIVLIILRIHSDFDSVTNYITYKQCYHDFIPRYLVMEMYIAASHIILSYLLSLSALKIFCIILRSRLSHLQSPPLPSNRSTLTFILCLYVRLFFWKSYKAA